MTRPRVVLLQPGVSPFVQQAALTLQERGWLHAFHTTLAYCPGTITGRVLRQLARLRPNGEAQIERRRLLDALTPHVVTRPLPELARLAAGRWLDRVAQDRIWEWGEIKFVQRVADSLSECDAVYGYEHAALEVMQRAKKMDLKRFYDMPAPHHKLTTALLDAEYDKYPALNDAYRRHTAVHNVRRHARRDEELSLADWVVCNSMLTENSLMSAGVARERIIRVPYGAPVPCVAREVPRSRAGKLHFLYAGTLSVRKGVPYLLGAWRQLNMSAHARLTMVGANNLPSELFRNLPGEVVVRPSVPRAELQSLYEDADLLVFPTLLDGFGMVLTEALAAGLPVLTTPRAGSSDLIDPGVNGFIVNPADASAIAERLAWCVENTEQLRSMRPACISSAARWQWTDYRQTLAGKIAEAYADR